MPLHRGAGVPNELTVIATPNNCSGHVDLHLEWDEEENWVRVKLKGKNALLPNPTVLRTPGVDYFPNPFWPEREDIVNGQYQLWFIVPAEVISYYYDGTTLELMGSEFEVDPPPDAIEIPSLTAKIFSTPFFQPKPNGDLDFEYEFAYDHVVRGDRPDLAHHFVAYMPPNLCNFDPFRIDRSDYRPVISPPRPASEARTFGDYLRNGLAFDITVEPIVPFTEPPYTTMIGSWSNVLGVSDGVPKDYTWDLDYAFMNVAPPIQPWPGAGTCENWTKPPHLLNLVDVCTP